jgi:hypothetical protein
MYCPVEEWLKRLITDGKSEKMKASRKNISSKDSITKH